MADIILNVSIKTPTLSQDAQRIANEIKASLDKIPVNENLTKQLESLAQYYRSVADAAKVATKDGTKNAIAEEKIAQAREKTRKATAQADLAEEKLIAQREKNKKITEEATETNKKHEKSVFEMAKGFLKWQLAATLVMKPLQMIRSGISDLGETVVEVESDVVSLRRVLKETFSDDSEISDEIFDLAIEYKRKYADVKTIVQNYARSGMTFEESIEASRAALLGMNVAELDAKEASEGLISIMNQFKLEADDLLDIIDAFDKSSDNAAVTTEKLLKALQRTGSSAKNANLSLEQTTGIITALSEATGRSGENLGTALNSLIQYSSKDSALETFAALSDNTAKVVSNYKARAANILDVWKAVSQEIKTLTAEQADALDAYFNTAEGAELSSELSAELGEVYDELGGVYDTANTFRKNYFISLLDNMDQVEEAIATAQSSAGYSAKENEAYLDTYEARANALEAKWKKIANDEQGILGFKKALVDGGSLVLDIVDATGGLTPVLLSIAAAGIAAFGPHMVANIKNYAAQLTKAQIASGVSSVSMSVSASAITYIVATYIQALNDRKRELENVYSSITQTARDFRSEMEDIDKRYRSESREISALDELIDRYDELNSKQILTADEKESLAHIVDVLSSTYQGLDFQLDKTTGKYSVLTEEIKKSRDEMLKSIEDTYKSEKASKAYATMQDILHDNGVKSIEELEKIYREWDSKSKQSPFWDAVGEEMDKHGPIAGLFMGIDDNIRAYDASKEAENKAKAFREVIDAYKEAKAIYDEFSDFVSGTEDKTRENTNETQEWEDALSAVSDKYGDIKKELQEILDLQKDEEELAERQKKLADARAKLEEERNKAKQDAILESLRAERKEKEETVTLAEKQLAVENARKALEDAKKQRRAYVYNAETGRFERQSVAESVQEAESDLQDAIEALNQYIEDQAWDSVISAVESGNTSLTSITTLLTQWKTEYDGDESVVQQILSAFKTGAGNADFSDAEKNLADAEEEYQDYVDQRLFEEVINMLGSGEKITSEQAKEMLNKYKGMGASSEAINSVTKKLEEASGTQILWDSKELLEKYLPFIQADGSMDFFGSRMASSSFTPPDIVFEPQAVDLLGATPSYSTQSTVSNTSNMYYTINGLTISQEQATALGLDEFCRNVSLIMKD